MDMLGEIIVNLDSVTKLSFLASNFQDELRSESLVGTMGGDRGGEALGVRVVESKLKYYMIFEKLRLHKTFDM